MKKFLKLTILFSLPIVVLLILFELTLRYIPNDYSYKCQYLNKNSDKIDVLFLGNSHVFYGINPEHSKFKSFNASHVSQSLNYDLAILEKYKNNWSNLKCIVIPVDYFSMYTTIETGIENWRVKNYNIYYNLNQSRNFEDNFELPNGKFSRNLLLLYSYYHETSSEITCNKLGWGTHYNSKRNKDLTERGKTAAKRHTVEVIDKACFEKNLKAIDNIIDFAKRKNIKVIFITCPAYKSYVEHLDQEQLKNTTDLITLLSSKNINSAYFNLLNDKSFTARDFYDGDHFNEIGAKKFTILMDDIIEKNRAK